MSITVCKFGGSSLSDAVMFRRAADIIRSSRSRRYIVLSAPGKRNPSDDKITDLFYRAYHADNAHSQYIFSQIRDRYTQIARELCPNFNTDALIDTESCRNAPTADFAASRGEYLCAKLFSDYTGIPFVDAADLIRFYEDGTLDMQSSCERIRSRLSALETAVIPGFYASLPDGSIKTFSRGGSDVTGAIIAAAMDADIYENWTDVDGLFTADPSLIPSAQRNPIVSLTEMYHIAEAGANLLHPDSLAVLRGTGIDTMIKNTFSPEAEGTRISESFTGHVKCITGKKSLSVPIVQNLTNGSCNIPGNHGTCCAISVFGMNPAALRQVHRKLKKVCIIHMHGHYILITQNDLYETSIRTIHELL